jgi:hypothetical protein
VTDPSPKIFRVRSDNRSNGKSFERHSFFLGDVFGEPRRKSFERHSVFWVTLPARVGKRTAPSIVRTRRSFERGNQIFFRAQTPQLDFFRGVAKKKMSGTQFCEEDVDEPARLLVQMAESLGSTAIAPIAPGAPNAPGAPGAPNAPNAPGAPGALPTKTVCVNFKWTHDGTFFAVGFGDRYVSVEELWSAPTWWCTTKCPADAEVVFAAVGDRRKSAVVFATEDEAKKFVANDDRVTRVCVVPVL